ncbi:MAG: hypothetical protein KA236_13035 [Verrucomicrobia bacterium]|jgi:hypothetical protein|nr:hypothetical protein [Verrucomicrobiota bacterium]
MKQNLAGHSGAGASGKPLPSTLEIIKSALRADPALSPADRAELLARLRQRPAPKEAASPPAAPPTVWTRARVAEALGGRSLRFVDELARTGVLRKIVLPGRQRACGFVAADVQRLIVAGTTENEGA